jgi:hypothetical protein
MECYRLNITITMGYTVIKKAVGKQPEGTDRFYQKKNK